MLRVLVLFLLFFSNSYAQKLELYGGVFQDFGISEDFASAGFHSSDSKLGASIGLAIDGLFDSKKNKEGERIPKAFHLRAEIEICQYKSDLSVRAQSENFDASGFKTDLRLNILPVCFKKHDFQFNFGFETAILLRQDYIKTIRSTNGGIPEILYLETLLAPKINYGPNAAIQYSIKINDKIRLIPRLKYGYLINEFDTPNGGLNANRISIFTSLQF